MKTTRFHLCFGLIALAAAGGACADSAYVTQFGSGDVATVDQTAASPGMIDAMVFQAGGSGNMASVQQSGVVGYGWVDISQVGTVSSTADAWQSGAAGFNTVMVHQSHGAGLLAVAGQMAVDGAYNHIDQTGHHNTAFSYQTGAQNSDAYVSQGGFAGGAYLTRNGTVTVDPNVQMAPTDNAHAYLSQTGADQTAYILQYGVNLVSLVHQSGGGNLAGTLQTGHNQAANILQWGHGGVATISQAGAGFLGVIDQGGAHNVATIQQR